MNIPTMDQTAAFLQNVADERRKTVGLMADTVILPLPNPKGDGPRVSTMMRYADLDGDDE